MSLLLTFDAGTLKVVFAFGGVQQSYPVQLSDLVCFSAWAKCNVKQIKSNAAFFVIYVLLIKRQDLFY